GENYVFAAKIQLNDSQNGDREESNGSALHHSRDQAASGRSIHAGCGECGLIEDGFFFCDVPAQWSVIDVFNLADRNFRTLIDRLAVGHDQVMGDSAELRKHLRDRSLMNGFGLWCGDRLLEFAFGEAAGDE